MKVLTDGYEHDNNGKDTEKKSKDEENHKVRDTDEGNFYKHVDVYEDIDGYETDNFIIFIIKMVMFIIMIK